MRRGEADEHEAVRIQNQIRVVLGMDPLYFYGNTNNPAPGWNKYILDDYSSENPADYGLDGSDAYDRPVNVPWIPELDQYDLDWNGRPQMNYVDPPWVVSK
jgi:hypothetical protein